MSETTQTQPTVEDVAKAKMKYGKIAMLKPQQSGEKQ
jgi:hypothetical protein